MPISSPWLRTLPLSRLFRQLENEMETVVTVLQPGPLGIIEHKFSAEEIHKANTMVQSAELATECNPREKKSHPRRIYLEVKGLNPSF